MVLVVASFWLSKKIDVNPNHQVGDAVDSLNHVIVYYNGGVSNISERNLSEDGYNIGLKYQCVEFVKRYYYQYYDHKMPDSYGNAKDFFDHTLQDGEINESRGLIQFTNGSFSKPKVGDLIVFGPTLYNGFGHVAIVSDVSENEVEIIQQNPGPFSSSRATFQMENNNEKWVILRNQTLGWLRLQAVSL